MIVKICGIRTLQDALSATDAGADMIGFNFYRASPRYLEPASCEELVKVLRQERARIPLLVGVFVNLPPPEVTGILDGCGLDLAQLSGDEEPVDVRMLRGRAFKAIRPRQLIEARSLGRAYRSALPRADAPAVLLDASSAGVYGGTGHAADWPIAGALAEEMPIMLAGGLRPNNVADAILAVRPWGVDVASGVERAPGVKDRDAMRAFIRIAKNTQVTRDGVEEDDYRRSEA